MEKAPKQPTHWIDPPDNYVNHHVVTIIKMNIGHVIDVMHINCYASHCCCRWKCGLQRWSEDSDEECQERIDDDWKGAKIIKFFCPVEVSGVENGGPKPGVYGDYTVKAPNDVHGQI